MAEPKPKLGYDDYRLEHSFEELMALPTIDLDDPKFAGLEQSYLKWKIEGTVTVEDIGLRNLTDLGNGERLALRERDTDGEYLIHYSQDSGWRCWNGSHWKPDTTSEIGRRAVHAVRLIHLEADKTNDKDRREAIFSWAIKSEAAARISSTVEMARLVPGVSVESDVWDTDSYLLNFKNGTLDLNTGSLRPHRRDDFITKCLDYEYDADAKCPVWDAFMLRVQPDELTRRYLLKAAAYCLSGSIGEQCIFILHGEGENGKTKFLEGIAHALNVGQYAGVMRTESLMLQRNGGDTAHDVALLRGLRFVYAVEPNSTSTFNSSFIKQQTGGERMMGRHFYKDFFDFIPTHKLWIGSNHDVRIMESDHGIQRRLKQTPFKIIITAEEKDPDIDKKFFAERAGIMASLVRYWQLYREEGLSLPPEVVDETKLYFERVDMLKDFKDECCNVGDDLNEIPAIMHKVYLNWAKRSGDSKPMKRLTFYARIREQFKVTMIDGKEIFKGIAVKPQMFKDDPWNDNR